MQKQRTACKILNENGSIGVYTLPEALSLVNHRLFSMALSINILDIDFKHSY